MNVSAIPNRVERTVGNHPKATGFALAAAVGATLGGASGLAFAVVGFGLAATADRE